MSNYCLIYCGALFFALSANAVTIIDQNSLSVELNSGEEHSCTPPDLGLQEGVWINAPSKVYLKAKTDEIALTALPVCGRYFLSYSKLENANDLVLVVKDTSTNIIVKGLASLDDSPTEPWPEELGPEQRNIDELEGMATGEVFNPNLTDFVSLPTIPATYEVYAEIGGAQSNTVTIEVLYSSDE